MGHPIITQNAQERTQRYSMHVEPSIESAAVYPLLSFDQVAGAIAIISPQKNLFTPAYQEIMPQYAKLFILAFEKEQFYPLHDILLGIMPPNTIQQKALSQFHADVNACMLLAEQNGQRLNRTDAENMVWKQKEGILLNTPSSHQRV